MCFPFLFIMKKFIKNCKVANGVANNPPPLNGKVKLQQFIYKMIKT